MMDNGINLEPRLVEYIRKKRYYKKNDVYPSIPLEKQYSITEEDKKLIYWYLKGKRDMVQNNTFGDYVDPTSSKFQTNDAYSDPRFDRIRNKLQKQKEAQQMRHNYGTIEERYSMYKQRVAPMSADDDYHVRGMMAHSNNIPIDYDESNCIADDDYHDGGMMTYQNTNPSNRATGDNFLLDSHDFATNNPYSVKSPQRRTYNNPPRVIRGRARQDNRFEDNNNVRKIIGELDTYHSNVERDYGRESNMDLDSRSVIPNINCNNKRGIGENNYSSVPYLMDKGVRDVDVENYIRNGVPDSKAKSLGYANPVEHYFDYISDDIQDPNHIVFERGVPTRLYNRQTARVGSLYHPRGDQFMQ